MSAGASVASPAAYAFVPQQGVGVSGMSAPTSSYPSTPQQTPNPYQGSGWAQGDTIARSGRAVSPGLRPESGTADLMVAPQPQTLQADKAATATDDVDALKASNESEKDVFYMCFGMAGFAAVAFPVFGELMKYRQKLQLKEFGDAEQGKFEAARKDPKAIENREWKGITDQLKDVVPLLTAKPLQSEAAGSEASGGSPTTANDSIQKDNRANALEELYEHTRQTMQDPCTFQNAEIYRTAHEHVRKHVIHFFGSIEKYGDWHNFSDSPKSYSSWIAKSENAKNTKHEANVIEKATHERFLTDIVDPAVAMALKFPHKGVS